MKTKDVIVSASNGEPKRIVTVFDKDIYNVQLNTGVNGEALRHALVEICGVQDMVSRLTAHFDLQVSLYEHRIKKGKYLAYMIALGDEKYLKANMEEKKILLGSYVFSLDDREVSLFDLEEEMAGFSYLANRGHDKLKEIYNVLDLGRSMYSWDKDALKKGM